MKSKLPRHGMLIGLAVLLAACAGSSASAPGAAHPEHPDVASTTPGIGSGVQSATSPEVQRQIKLLDRFEGLVNKFDSAVTNLEQAKNEWGFAQAGDLSDIGSVVDGIGKQRGGVPEAGLDKSLEPRLDAMVKPVQGISARYMTLQPKMNRLVASLKTQGTTGEPQAP